MKQWIVVSERGGGKRAVKISDIVSMEEIIDGYTRYTSLKMYGVAGWETLVVYGRIEIIVAEINGEE